MISFTSAHQEKYRLTLWQLAEWVEHNLHRAVTITEMEQKTGYSARHLYTLFHTNFGISIAGYIRKRRLTLASVMLRETSRSVTEIALMYNFNHVQTFSRAFKDHFGQSPQSYRQADRWNMAHYYPSVVVKKPAVKITLCDIDKSHYLKIRAKNNYQIDFGYNFLLATKEMEIISYPQIHRDFIKLIFSNNLQKSLTVFGELIPGKNCDTEIDLYIGILNHNIKDSDDIRIPAGNYARFCRRFLGFIRIFSDSSQ
ncbi:helix-turn-helix domain-containing protein [Salmonella enterica]|nr:helix-turn-helix domain-containing protein [Salmonella enterica]